MTRAFFREYVSDHEERGVPKKGLASLRRLLSVMNPNKFHALECVLLFLVSPLLHATHVCCGHCCLLFLPPRSRCDYVLTLALLCVCVCVCVCVGGSYLEALAFSLRKVDHSAPLFTHPFFCF
jgi:hypothetical protein